MPLAPNDDNPKAAERVQDVFTRDRRHDQEQERIRATADASRFLRS